MIRQRARDVIIALTAYNVVSFVVLYFWEQSTCIRYAKKSQKIDKRCVELFYDEHGGPRAFLPGRGNGNTKCCEEAQAQQMGHRIDV